MSCFSSSYSNINSSRNSINKNFVPFMNLQPISRPMCPNIKNLNQFYDSNSKLYFHPKNNYLLSESHKNKDPFNIFYLPNPNDNTVNFNKDIQVFSNDLSKTIQNQDNSNYLNISSSVKKDNVLLNKKRKIKKIKKLNHSYIKKKKKKIYDHQIIINEDNYEINQISVNGCKIKYFPLFSDNKNLYSIEINNKLINFLTKKFKSFKIINYSTEEHDLFSENELKQINFSKELLKTKKVYFFNYTFNALDILLKFYSIFVKIFQKLNDLLEKDVKKIYFAYYLLKLQNTIRNYNDFANFLIEYKNNNEYINEINEDLNSTKKKLTFTPIKNNQTFLPENIPTHTLINNSEDLATNLKDNKENNNSLILSNILCQKLEKKILFKSKKITSSSFKCDFCERIFKNGQALGGHISQAHPNQSFKYKKKLNVRNNRKEKRDIILQARKNILKKYQIDYDYLMFNKKNKVIKEFINEHKGEYKKEINHLKKNKPNDSNINKKQNILFITKNKDLES